MKGFTKAVLALALVGCMAIPPVAMEQSVQTEAASSKITTTPTGYTKASDVKYVTKDNTRANWGARNENCTFLSTYAESFYTGSYVYETLSQEKGGTGQGNAASSALYASLKSLMTNKQSHQTSYNETKALYCCTDCVSNNYNNISSFYSGKTLTGKWDGAATWNREHTWPNSKGLGGNDENDIMMLRPTWVQENSSRGNTAYGEGSSYYDPGVSTRGDCARIVLYVYVRWGNTSRMWGTSGVMENMNILLKWMEEDPVDTWEMGRNDAVQSITGTRNVFVDYPEYAWLLFGKSVPKTVTPSGIAKGDSSVESSSEVDSSVEDSSSEVDSSVEDSSSEVDSSAEDSSSEVDSSVEDSSSEVDSSVEDSSSEVDSSVEDSSSQKPNGSSESEESTQESACSHEYGKWFTNKKPTETEEGERQRFCQLCGHLDKEILPALSQSNGATDEIQSGEGSGDTAEESGGDGTLTGCNGSVLSAPILVVGLLAAYVFKKRKYSK